MQNGGQVLACPPSANIQLYGSSIPHPKGKQRFYIFKYASRNPGIWAAKTPDKIGVFAEHIFFMFLLWRRGRDSNPCGVAPKRFSRPPRYDRFDTSPYMKLPFDRNHQIFNCFRNSFRNALLCCCQSAEKVRCCKAFQGFCDRYAHKFSSPFCPGYSTFQQQKTSES